MKCFFSPLAEITVVVCDTNKKVSNLLDRFAETPGLKVAVVMEEPSGAVLNLAKTLNVSILRFSDVEVYLKFVFVH